jgi:hypothetical protein
VLTLAEEEGRSELRPFSQTPIPAKEGVVFMYAMKKPHVLHGVYQVD